MHGQAGPAGSAQEAPIPHHHTRMLRGSIALSLLVLGACFGDKHADSGTITDAERAAFAAPADSSLTAKQIDQYLRTALAQLEMLRAEAPAARERLAVAERERVQTTPTTRKGPRPKSPQAQWSEFVNATFVRSARKLGYNPAELDYVRGRFSAVSGHLLAVQMHGFTDEGAALFRQQAEMMRGTPGVSQAQIETMLRAAAQAEEQKAPAARPGVEQNLGVLRRAYGAVSDAIWGEIAGVAAGIRLSELRALSDAERGRELDKLRQLHQQVLETRK
jgi:hypothetical protein